MDHYDPELCVPSRVRCVDLPPLVPGSWSGRGVGSELIVKHCAAADVLVVCVRAFEGQTVTHSLGGGGTVNPLRDLDLMMDELFDLDKANISGDARLRNISSAQARTSTRPSSRVCIPKELSRKSWR